MKRLKPAKGQRRTLLDGKQAILIEPKDKDYTTYIKSDFEYDENDLREESNPFVYCKQKWVVDLIEKDFSKERLFRCVREVHWILGPYLRTYTENGIQVKKIRDLK